MKRSRFGAFVLSGFILSGLMLAVPANAETKRRFISIGTGGVTGVYFAAGNAICRMVEEEGYASHADGGPLALRCAYPSTSGSEENLVEIAKGNLDFGLVQSDLQFVAYTNDEPDRITHFPELRSVFSLYSEPLHLVAADGLGIEKFTDLRGKWVNLGTVGSGHRATMEFLMRRHRLDMSDFGLVSELATLEIPNALCRGDIDAFVLAVGVPNSVVAIATDGCGARIVPLDTEVEQAIVRDRPYYVRATIPAYSYRTLDNDTVTFGVIATLVTRADVEDGVVYEVAKAVMRNLATFRLLHPAFSNLKPQNMIRDGLSAPLHTGARKFYIEEGWIDGTKTGESEHRTLPQSKRRQSAMVDAQSGNVPKTGAILHGAVPMVFPQNAQ